MGWLYNMLLSAQTERGAAVRQEIAQFPPVSILGCEHMVVVSQSNGISHTGEVWIVVASTTDGSLQEMLLRGQRFGLGVAEEWNYGIHAVNPSFYCILKSLA